ncbi:LytR/AlgR family response regulator transcription factor [Algoriphagus resistens]|uniref:LytR/AlgR family response regulator transcription factor n=1 Tax=Algoriphagus resistens TaxID=1750590 RepID=UPI0007169E97|nr:LytTR family DNA-binding domain-containing protein [Algoriphagus resistens]
MLKSIIIEDQAPAQFILEKFIGDTEFLKLEKTFSDAVEARGYLESHPVDLVFLDINLPLLSGMDFLRTSANQPLTILTTAYSEFALECYQYNVVDYLLKPFSFERFTQAIEKVLNLTRTLQHFSEEKASVTSGQVYFRSSHDLVKVDCKDIIFITSDSDYTEVITASQKYLTLDPLREWSAKLDGDFIQAHKSFIINLNHLIKTSKNKIHLSKDHVIPIGRVFKKRLMDAIERRK